MRESPSCTEFAAAAAANLEGVERAQFQVDPDAARSRRRHDMGMHLASMLAADIPAGGLRVLASAGMNPKAVRQDRGIAFAKWACEYLARGNARDDAFFRESERWLKDGLLAELLAQAAYLQAVLCLKAIYFDSGRVKTARQAIAKAYEWLPTAGPGGVGFG